MTAPRETRDPSAAEELADDREAPEQEHERAVERVLENAALPEVRQGRDVPRMRTGTVTVHGGRGTGLPASYVVTVRGGLEIEVELDDGVDPELVARASRSGDRVLLEEDPELGAVIVGVLQTRLPETLELKANHIVIDAESEVTIRSGKAGMRLREDGDVELVGSRIVTMSRGLFRLVGRMLRLN
ncbi:MAG: hypothetical protein U0414_26160 [Polyangiaceae bacterium]